MMKGFVYFLPGLTNYVTRENMIAAGVGHALTVGNPTSRGTQAGPEGLGGYLAAPTGPFEAPPLYEPEKQVWQAGPGKKFFVGYWKDSPPGPAALAKDRIIPGEPLPLGDGNTWTVPVAISFAAGRGSTLPRRFVIGADGQSWEMSVEPRFVHLCEHAEEVVAAWLGGEENSTDGSVKVSLDFARSMQMCVDALACNYRVGPIEVSLLRLINTDTRWDILKALIDMITMQQVDALGQKKSDTPVTSAT